MKLVLFTDLDGTLLDPYSYSYQESLAAVNLLQAKRIPVIFCSAKTKAEQEVYREALGITDPFIVEEGGAILIPQGYFPFTFEHSRWVGNYALIELGSPYERILQALNKLKGESPCQVKGFRDLRAEEVAQDSGLSPMMAVLAKQRQYSETLRIKGPGEEIRKFLRRIEEEGLSWSRGERYYRIKGKGGKGEAAKILLRLFQKAFAEILSVGIGNSISDLSLLKAVDLPLLVQKPEGEWEEMNLPGLRRVKGIGPAGWSRAVKDLLNNLASTLT